LESSYISSRIPRILGLERLHILDLVVFVHQL
jgi:hypothetical protein